MAYYTEENNSLADRLNAGPDLSLAPIDVGFDPRAHDMTCRIPRTAVRVRYETHGDTRDAVGTIEQIVAELKSAGYRVEASDE